MWNFKQGIFTYSNLIILEYDLHGTYSTYISLENTMLNFPRFTAVNRLWRPFWNIPALSYCLNLLYLVYIV